MKMGQRLRCSSVTSRPSFGLLLIYSHVTRTKLGRDAPSTASPARTALPTAHFDRNKIPAISGTGH